MTDQPSWLGKPIQCQRQVSKLFFWMLMVVSILSILVETWLSKSLVKLYERESSSTISSSATPTIQQHQIQTLPNHYVSSNRTIVIYPPPPPGWVRPERWNQLLSQRRAHPNTAPLDIIFIHIPKTGGESMEVALDIRKRHFTAAQRQGEIMKKNHYYLVISIVRNPYDRMVSWYEHCRKVQYDPTSKYYQTKTVPNPVGVCQKALETNTDFQIWLEWAMIHRSEGRLKSGNWAFAPCTSWIMDETQQQQHDDDEDKKMGSFLVDFVLRFEHLEQDYERLQNILEELGHYYNHDNGTTTPSLRRRTPLPKANASRRLNRTVDYFSSEKSRKWIEQVFASDLQQFGYQLGG